MNRETQLADELAVLAYAAHGPIVRGHGMPSRARAMARLVTRGFLAYVAAGALPGQCFCAPCLRARSVANPSLRCQRWAAITAAGRQYLAKEGKL